MKVELRKSFQFEAAHLLPLLPRAHKCRRLHGHSFKVEVVVAGECDRKLGWLMDYADISAAFKPIAWIWRKLKPKLPLLSEVIVAETCTAQCRYRGESYQLPK